MMAASGKDKWTCPNDRQLALRAKLQRGWSFKTEEVPTLRRQQSTALTDKEQQAILAVIRRAESLEVTEKDRVGRLLDRLEKIKKNVMGNGTTQCILCGENFGFLNTAKQSLICWDCNKAVCQKCGVETMVSSSPVPVWLCKICAETREIWKKSGAWFYKGIPYHLLDGSRSDGRGKTSPTPARASAAAKRHSTWSSRSRANSASDSHSASSSTIPHQASTSEDEQEHEADRQTPSRSSPLPTHEVQGSSRMSGGRGELRVSKSCRRRTQSISSSSSVAEGSDIDRGSNYDDSDDEIEDLDKLSRKSSNVSSTSTISISAGISPYGSRNTLNVQRPSFISDDIGSLRDATRRPSLQRLPKMSPRHDYNTDPYLGAHGGSTSYEDEGYVPSLDSLSVSSNIDRRSSDTILKSSSTLQPNPGGEDRRGSMVVTKYERKAYTGGKKRPSKKDKSRLGVFPKTDRRKSDSVIKPSSSSLHRSPTDEELAGDTDTERKMGKRDKIKLAVKNTSRRLSAK